MGGSMTSNSPGTIAGQRRRGKNTALIPRQVNYELNDIELRTNRMDWKKMQTLSPPSGAIFPAGWLHTDARDRD
jgi:hypothetical protein